MIGFHEANYIIHGSPYTPVSVGEVDHPLLPHPHRVQLLQAVVPHGDDVTQLARGQEVKEGTVLHPRPVAHESKSCLGDVRHSNLLVQVGDKLLDCC